MSSEVTELSMNECDLLLASVHVGRIAVVDDGYPLVFPINFKVDFSSGKSVISIRTRPDNIIDTVGRMVCFEIDGVDASGDGGWSVLVRGVLVETPPDPDLDPQPIATENRDAWRLIVPTRITGRRVRNRTERWSFHPAGYI
jgi:nitroimidazol reductase NimA-like FMN-containing flavoprotein (pyridoxamine 5'-phosphate oxidase superfamily)